MQRFSSPLRPLLTCSLLLVSGAASAEARAPFNVERGPGAESCPDTAALNREVEALRGRSEQRASSYRVRFERTRAVYEASIVSAADQGERKLTDSGTTCSALGRATAVTLALLLDADPVPAPHATDAVARVVPPSLGSAQAVALPPELPRRAAQAVTVHAGGALLAGVVRPVAPGLVGGLGFSTRKLHLELGVVWLVPTSVEFEPGHVIVSLLAGKVDACLAIARPGFARVDLCSGFIAGFVQAEAQGFTRNDEQQRPWLGVPLGLTLRSESAPFGWDAGISALVPVRRQDFQIDGLGVVYSSLPVAGFVWLRAVGVVPW